MTHTDPERPGECPVCGADFNCPPQPDELHGGFRPPSLVLEVGGSLDDDPPLPWRLRVIGTSRERRSDNRRFTTAGWTYVLCGSGHYFLTAVAGQTRRQHARLSFGDQSFAAAIGPVASGKSYLLVRTLNQPLIPEGSDFWQADPPVVQRRSDPLEAVPKYELDGHYGQTLASTHEPIPPTRRQDLMPSVILRDNVSDEIFDAATELQREVMQNERETNWGTGVRQPIFLRTRTGDRSVLTCIADLAGELFDIGTREARSAHRTFQGMSSLQQMMPLCSSVIWVIDPLHGQTRTFQRFLAAALKDPELYGKVVSGSSRPDERADRDVDADLAKRAAVGGRIAGQLTDGASLLAQNLGATLRNLVVVSKCDLVELALRTSGLDALGKPGSVVDGTATYLEHLARNRTTMRCTSEVAWLLDYLGATDGQGRSDQVAEALVDHYSDHASFWNLVHDGGRLDRRGRPHPEKIQLPASDDGYVLEQQPLTVPTADQHLLACLEPHASGVLHMRDVVMSALGCGIMYGLGHGQDVRKLLLQQWRSLQFFLCSPLGTVPLSADRTVNTLTPIDDAGYPEVHGRSAGLQQLWLRILKEALP